MKKDLFSGDFKLITSTIHELNLLDKNLYYELNVKNEIRYTPLHCAIFSRNFDAVYTLVQNGADVNTKCFGTPCIHLALTIAMLPDGYSFGLNCFQLFLENVHNVTDKVNKKKKHLINFINYYTFFIRMTKVIIFFI